MLHAQFLERFLEWSYAPSLQIRVPLPDTFDGFRIVLPFPFERLGQHVVERGRRVPVRADVRSRLAGPVVPVKDALPCHKCKDCGRLCQPFRRGAFQRI